MSRWEEDVFSQGAYSYICNDTDATSCNINDKIFFAGEHTDPVYYGSMHAAYNSGCRVLDEMRKLVCSMVS